VEISVQFVDYFAIHYTSIMKKIPQMESDALRQKAEASLSNEVQKSIGNLSEAEIYKLLHELEVHQIELQLQNEELIQAKEQAVAASEKYIELYDFAPTGYFSLSRKGEIIQLNLTAAKMLGKGRSQVKNKLFQTFVSLDSLHLFNVFLGKVFNSNFKESCELTLLSNGEKPLYFYLTGILNENGDQCFVTATDISERRKAEIQLKKRSDFDDTLLKTIPFGMDIVDENGNILYMSEGFKDHFGIDAQAKKCWELYRDDQKQCEDCPLHDGIKVGLTETYVSHGVSGGKTFEISHTGMIFNGQKALLEIFIDITERKKAELALMKSDERFELAMKASNDGLFDWNLETNDIYYSPGWKRILGYEDHELPNDFSVWETTTHPEDVLKSWELQQKLISKQTDRFVMEFKMKHKDGHWVDILSRAEAVFNEQGKAIRIVGTHTDITERKQTQEKILRSEERYRSLIGNLEAGIVVHAPDTSIVMNNARATELLGISDEQMRGKKAIDTVWKFVNHDLTPLPLNDYPVNRIINTKQPIKNQTFGTIQPGKSDVVWLTVNGLPMFNSSGEITEIVISFIDITERKQAELKIKESEEKYRLLVNYSRDPIFVFNPDESYRFVNEAFASAFGKTPEEIIGKTPHSIFSYEEAEKRLMLVRKVFETGERKDIEVKVQTASGEERHFLTIVDPIQDNTGKILWVSCISKDITKRKLAEESIRKMGEHFQALIEKAPDGIALISSDGNFKYISPSAKKMFGYTEKDEVIGHPDQYTHPDDLPMVLTELGKMLADPAYVPTLQYRFIDKQGSWRWIETTFSNLLAHPSVESIVLNFRDITERKQAEEEIIKARLKAEESEEFFRSIFENSPVGKSITSLDGDLKTNKAFSNLLGYSFEEFQTKSFKDITHPDDMQKTIDAVDTLLKGQKSSIQFEKRYLHKNGSTVYADVVTTLQKDRNGKPMFFITSVNDITVRMQFETEIRKKEERFRSVIQAVSEGIILQDHEGRIVTWNPAAERIFGLTAKEAEGQISTELMWKTFREDGTPFPGEEHPSLISLKTGESCLDVVMGVQTWQGNFTWIKVNTNPLFRQNKSKPYAVVISFSDITERKRVEAELINAKEHAEESDQLKSSFLANMSHEIRTPLNSIIGFSDLLNDPDYDEQQKSQFTRTIIDNGNNLMVIISDIMDLSMITAGQMKFRTSHFSPKNLLEDLMIEFGLKASDKGIELRISTPPEVEGLVVESDNYRIRQILANLIGNAIKFTSHGFVEFGFSVKDHHVEFQVEDTGIGISKDHFETIFDRFRQIEITKTRRYGGNGLGLAISKNLAELLGGRIWVDSEVGKGSLFHFSIPIHSQSVQENISPVKIEKFATNIKIRNLKILIAEDDDPSCQLISIEVGKFAKEIILVQTGTEAVEACRNHPDIDLVLMDIQMPEMDGHEATQLIRKFNQEVVIIAQTAFALSGDREKAMEAGCTDYISKPIKRENLTELLQKYFPVNDSN
jgi:PAS domain S-box-containing protein